MADETKIGTEMGADNRNVDVTNKRKRVKRIKTAIIIIIIFLLIIPTILCIIFGMQLCKLQRQVDNLLSTYSINTEEKGRKSISGKYAYASTDGNAVENMDITDTEKDDKSQIHLGHKNDIDVIDATNIDDNNITIDITDTKGKTDTQEDADFDDKRDTRYDTESGIPGKVDQGSTHNSTEHHIDPEGIYNDKKVYLTFDDGPSRHTDEILDILAEYNVKATFFVIGHEDEVSKERYKRIIDEGHILGIHSYSHKYKEIYKSIEDFDKDFTKLWKLLYDITGYKPTLYRFPGGSLHIKDKNKMKEYVRYLDENGMSYYDWNVVNGDAEGIDYTEEQMIDNVLNGVVRKKTSIVLMHDGDGKSKTVSTLPDILDALISGGAEVLPMDETVPLIQQIKASSLK